MSYEWFQLGKIYLYFVVGFFGGEGVRIKCIKIIPISNTHFIGIDVHWNDPRRGSLRGEESERRIKIKYSSSHQDL